MQFQLPDGTSVPVHPQNSTILYVASDVNQYRGDHAAYGSAHFSAVGYAVYKELIDKWNRGIHPPFAPHHDCEDVAPREFAWLKVNKKWRALKRTMGFE